MSPDVDIVKVFSETRMSTLRNIEKDFSARIGTEYSNKHTVYAF